MLSWAKQAGLKASQACWQGYLFGLAGWPLYLALWPHDLAGLHTSEEKTDRLMDKQTNGRKENLPIQ